MDLRQAIEEGCEMMNISERELARRARLGVGTITLWKTGRRSPRLAELARLAKALWMPTLELVAIVLNELGEE